VAAFTPFGAALAAAVFNTRFPFATTFTVLDATLFDADFDAAFRFLHGTHFLTSGDRERTREERADDSDAARLILAERHCTEVALAVDLAGDFAEVALTRFFATAEVRGLHAARLADDLIAQREQDLPRAAVAHFGVGLRLLWLHVVLRVGAMVIDERLVDYDCKQRPQAY